MGGEQEGVADVPDVGAERVFVSELVPRAAGAAIGRDGERHLRQVAVSVIAVARLSKVKVIGVYAITMSVGVCSEGVLPWTQAAIDAVSNAGYYRRVRVEDS